MIDYSSVLHLIGMGDVDESKAWLGPSTRGYWADMWPYPATLTGLAHEDGASLAWTGKSFYIITDLWQT